MFRPLVISAVGIIAMSVPALAEPVPSNEELFRMLKEQQQTIKELRNELKRSRTQTAAVPARVPNDARTAMAADLPMARKAAPFTPAWNWSGFYIGAHGGYGWKDDDFAEVISTAPLLTIGGIDSKGWVFGGHAGYNWQYGPWVAGVEIDFSATGIKGDSNPLVRNLGGGVSITDVEGDDVKWLGTARARVGYAPYSNWLFYGTGGLAWERLDQIETTILIAPGVSQTVVSRNPTDWFGWVAGAGLEVRLFDSNWIARVEYLHYDFGSTRQSTSVVTSPGTSFSDRDGSQTIDVVRGGLSYKFCSDYCTSDWGKGPVVAKY